MPVSYRLIGPPDLLHDLLLDFADIGWATASHRWLAVVSSPPGDAAAPAPDWPAEVTLAGVSHVGHDQTCRDHFSGA